MAKWTPQELSALGTTKSYEEWARETGSAKTFDSWEVKRRRFARDGSPPDRVPLAAPVPLTGQERDYIGLNIGFFDIETTFSTQPIMLYGAIADGFGRVRQFRKGLGHHG